MNDFIKQITRKLRKNQTPSEAKIWNAVRNRQIDGKKFLRQHPIRFEINGRRRFFIADFYCHEKNLIVEIDGKIHEKQRDYDMLRTRIVNELGMQVIRFRNEEVENNFEWVIKRLRSVLLTHPPTSFS